MFFPPHFFGKATNKFPFTKILPGCIGPMGPIFFVRPEGGGEGEEVPEPQEPPTAPEEDEVRGGGLTGRFF